MRQYLSGYIRCEPYVAWHLFKGRVKVARLEKRYHARAFSVEDRDCRSLEEAERTWRQPNQNRWIWRRHEIENYLLEPRLVTDAFRALRRDRVRGSDKLPDDPDAVFHELQGLAQPMLEDHTGWLVYWQLVFDKRNTADTRLNGCPVSRISMALKQVFINLES